MISQVHAEKVESRSMKKFILNLSVIPLSGLFSLAAQAELGYEEYRHIHINGSHLEDSQILALDKMLGYEVPNGFYWINESTGEWGYQGSDEVLGSVYPRNGSGNTAGAQVQQPVQQESGSSRPYISNDTGTGSAVIDPNGCSYVSSGGMTFRSCD